MDNKESREPQRADDGSIEESPTGSSAGSDSLDSGRQQPWFSISPATQAEIDQLDADADPVDGAAALYLYDKLVAILNEYGTATVLKGLETLPGLWLSQESVEAAADAAMRVVPVADDPNNPVCYSCGYRRDNTAVHPRSDHCTGYVEVPEALRFRDAPPRNHVVIVAADAAAHYDGGFSSGVDAVYGPFTEREAEMKYIVETDRLDSLVGGNAAEYGVTVEVRVLNREWSKN